MELSHSEQLSLQRAESAKTMVSTDYWTLLIQALVNDEVNCLIELYDYLASEKHPDREEVMTLCLKWFAMRRHRLLWLGNVRESLDYKELLKRQVLGQLSQEPLSDEAQAILSEYGEM